VRDTLCFVAVILAIWWTGLTLLFVRDYVVKLRDSRRKGPLSEEERREKEAVFAHLPHKEVKSVSWYLRHPRELRMLGFSAAIILPFLVIFLPMVLLGILLPDPNRK
jgi:hypothetical protein